MKKIYQIAFSLSILIILLFANSCDLNSPVDIELISISEENLDFGLFETELEFRIENSDTTSALWDIRVWPGWISAEPYFGTLDGGDSETIKIRVTRDDLGVGEYTGDIFFSIQGVEDDLYIQVNMEISPVLVIPTRNQNLSSSDTRGSFSIENEGNYKLIWKVFSLQDWLTVEPDSGETDPASNQLFVKNDEERRTDSGSTVDFVINRNRLDTGLNVGIIEVRSNSGIDSVYVTVSQDEGPRLSVSEDQLNFDESNTTHTITVDNTGGGILSWEASSPDNWVSINPDHGDLTTQALSAELSKYNILTKTLSTDAVQVEISVEMDELEPGEITSRVEFTSNGGSHTIELNVEVAEHPELDLSTDELNFGSEFSSLTFDIINSGNGTLDWTAEPSAGILTVTPQSGSTQTSETVTVELDRTQLDAADESSYTISIQSNGGNETIDVFANGLMPAEISVTPDELKFDSQTTQLPLSITNLGEEILNWDLSADVDWLTFSSTAGEVPGGQQSEIMVTLSPQASDLAGEQTGTITFTGNGGTAAVIVEYTAPEPAELSYSPDELEFDENALELPLTLTNRGEAALNWEVNTAAAWLIMSPQSGTLPGISDVSTDNSTDVSVKIDPAADLAPGTYNAEIEITSNGGNGTVIVTYIVPEEPAMVVDPVILNFGTTIEEIEISVTFINVAPEDTYTWTAETNDNWMTLEKVTGASPNAKEEELKVTVIRDGMNAGDYQGNIEIKSDLGTVNVEVKMSVASNPILSVSTEEIDFGTDSDQEIFYINNDGNDEFTWSSEIEYKQGGEWLSIEPSNGTTSQQTEIKVLADRDKINEDDNEAVIHIYSDAGNADVEVKLTSNFPKLDVSTKSLDFGTDLTQLSFDVLNKGGQELNWSINISYEGKNDLRAGFSSSSNWLSVYPDYGTTTDKTTVSVTAIRESLDTGTYRAKIFVNSEFGEKEIRVEMTIE